MDHAGVKPSTSSAQGGGEGTTRNAGDDCSHLYVFTADKGGMAGCDKALQHAVIYELSQGSKHMEHAKHQDAKVDARIEQMQSAILQVTPHRRRLLERQTDQIAAAAESRRDFSRWCCVVDMDMFYAAVEIRDQPTFAERPVAVGGLGMISTANYVARRYGVRSAMPGFIAQELCRRQGVELHFIRPDFGKYTKEAHVIRDVIGEYGQYEAHSLDEACVDITDRVQQAAAASQGSELDAAAGLVRELRAKITERTGGLTASAGIAPNFALAKLAADEEKPNGQFVVPREREALLAWLQPKPIRKVGGVGKVTEKMLSALGAETIADVLRVGPELLVAFPGVRSEWLIGRALGVAPCTLDVHDEGDGVVRRKSISNEKTFRDEGSTVVLLGMLRELCAELATEMAKEGLAGKTVTVKMKHATFEVVTRAQSSRQWVGTSEDIWEHANEIFQRELPCTLRLIGVRVSNFRNAAPAVEDPRQPKLQKFFVAKSKVAGPVEDIAEATKDAGDAFDTVERTRCLEVEECLVAELVMASASRAVAAFGLPRAAACPSSGVNASPTPIRGVAAALRSHPRPSPSWLTAPCFVVSDDEEPINNGPSGDGFGGAARCGGGHGSSASGGSVAGASAPGGSVFGCSALGGSTTGGCNEGAFAACGTSVSSHSSSRDPVAGHGPSSESTGRRDPGASIPQNLCLGGPQVVSQKQSSAPVQRSVLGLDGDVADGGRQRAQAAGSVATGRARRISDYLRPAPSAPEKKLEHDMIVDLR